MDLWEAVVVAFRRWYVMLPVLLIGIFVAWRLAESVAPVHEASATVQYLPPAVNTFDQETAFAFAANPYSDLRSLAFATELSVQAEDFAAELKDRGFDAEFSVETDRREPVLDHEVDAHVGPFGRGIECLSSEMRRASRDFEPCTGQIRWVMAIR